MAQHYPTRQWSSRQAAIRYYQTEGFVTGVALCLNCHHRHDTAFPPQTNPERLECPRCHKQLARFTPDPPIGPIGNRQSSIGN